MQLKTFDPMQPIDAYNKAQDRQRTMGLQDYAQQRQVEGDRRIDEQYQRSEAERPKLQRLADRKQEVQADSELKAYANTQLQSINPDAPDFEEQKQQAIADFTNMMHKRGYDPAAIESYGKMMLQSMNPDAVRYMQEKAGIRPPSKTAVFGKPQAKDYTPESIAEYQATGDYSKLRRADKEIEGMSGGNGQPLQFRKGTPEEIKFKKQIATDYEKARNTIADGDRVLGNALQIIGGTDPKTGKEYKPHPGLEMATGTSRFAESVMPAWTDTAKATRRISEFKEQMQAIGKNMMPGLGSMAVQEWPKVEALISQIDPAADTEIVKDKINKAVAAFQEFTNIAKSKFNKQYKDQLDQYPEFKLDETSSSKTSDGSANNIGRFKVSVVK